jgi:ribosomal protein S18 acetylase RimI-like enzyme
VTTTETHPTTTVRPITPEDVERVLVLWGGNAGDQLDMLSYDRWGPGVAVPARPSVAEVEALVQDPLDGVRELLHASVDGAATFCLVAELGGAVRGFLTGEVATQAGNDFRIGTIHELYVEPAARRHGLATGLVERAVVEFRRRGARQFRVELDPGWREGMAFWRQARPWRQDAVVFNHYE